MSDFEDKISKMPGSRRGSIKVSGWIPGTEPRVADEEWDERKNASKAVPADAICSCGTQVIPHDAAGFMTLTHEHRREFCKRHGDKFKFEPIPPMDGSMCRHGNPGYCDACSFEESGSAKEEPESSLPADFELGVMADMVHHLDNRGLTREQKIQITAWLSDRAACTPVPMSPPVRPF